MSEALNIPYLSSLLALRPPLLLWPSLVVHLLPLRSRLLH